MISKVGIMLTSACEWTQVPLQLQLCLAQPSVCSAIHLVVLSEVRWNVFLPATVNNECLEC